MFSFWKNSKRNLAKKLVFLLITLTLVSVSVNSLMITDRLVEIRIADFPGNKQDQVIFVFQRDATISEINATLSTVAKIENLTFRNIEIKNKTETNKIEVFADTSLHNEDVGLFGQRLYFKPVDNVTIKLEFWKSLIVENASLINETATRKVYVAKTFPITYYLPKRNVFLLILISTLMPFLCYVFGKIYSSRILKLKISNVKKLHKLRIFSVLSGFTIPVSFVLIGIYAGIFDVIGWFSYLLGFGAEISVILIALLYTLVMFLSFFALSLSLIDVESKIRKFRISERELGSLTIRQLLLILLPIFIWQMIVVKLPSGILENTFMMFGILGVFIAFIAIFSSYFLLLLGKTEKLDNEVIRREILSLCKKMGVRIRDVRIIKIFGPKIANACVSGALPNFRYVFLTDYLIETFTIDEIKAVIAHELAHAKKHHLAIQSLLALGWAIF